METLDEAIQNARARYLSANPASMAAHKDAERYLPGGNTRAVLHYEPFPLTMIAGQGAELVDLDGHRYVDFVGEFSAGLFGHSNETIKLAIHDALDKGIVLGAPNSYERELAGILCERFPTIQQIRFCNSGTEANILALSTARAVTGRRKLLVFNGAYHGSVLKFPTGNSTFNVPFDFLIAEYNDIEGTAEVIRQARDELAAVLVEPVLGAGGNIPGDKQFLEMLKCSTREVGALLIFDEVKTGRLGPRGVQGLVDIQPDMTTLGKFIGGGLPLGAFGGKAEIMARFNPKLQGFLSHAGTFNNNVCSMAAGCAAVGQVFTPERAAEFLRRSEAYRSSLNEMLSRKMVPMCCSGLGSLMTVHFSKQPIQKPVEKSAVSRSLNTLLHVELLLHGVLICSRGDLYLSLPMTDEQLSKAYVALEEFVDRHEPLIARVL